MSHITEIETVVNDLDALAEAAKRLGGELVRDQKSYRWFGRWVGDTPAPPDLKVEDMGKCHHAIRIKGCNYEVGVTRKADGSFRLQFDYYDGALNRAIGGPKAPKLMQAYAVEKAKAEARRKGHLVMAERVLADGTIRLQLGVR
jgi:hypothetical protein